MMEIISVRMVIMSFIKLSRTWDIKIQETQTSVLIVIESELWKWYTRYQPVYHFYFVF